MPEGVPDFVSSSFELITPTAAIGVLFIVIRSVTDSLSGGVLLPQVIMDVLAPAIGSLDSLWIIYFVLVLRLVFWFSGFIQQYCHQSFHQLPCSICQKISLLMKQANRYSTWLRMVRYLRLRIFLVQEWRSGWCWRCWSASRYAIKGWSSGFIAIFVRD